MTSTKSGSLRQEQKNPFFRCCRFFAFCSSLKDGESTANRALTPRCIASDGSVLVSNPLRSLVISAASSLLLLAAAMLQGRLSCGWRHTGHDHDIVPKATEEQQRLHSAEVSDCVLRCRGSDALTFCSLDATSLIANELVLEAESKFKPFRLRRTPSI